MTEARFIIDEDGRRTPAVLWSNPTANTATINVQTSAPRYGTDPTTGGMRIVTPEVRRDYIVPAGESLLIPAEFTGSIHAVECHEADCAGKRGRCSSPMTHRGARVIGGLGPMLVREGQPYSVLPTLFEGVPRPRPIATVDLADPLRVAAASAADARMAAARARAAAARAGGGQ
jgi:hypothetical protein